MERKDLRSYKEHKSTKYQNKWGGGNNFGGMANFSVGSVAPVLDRRAL